MRNIHHNVLETFTKKNLQQNLTRFYCELFELGILENFTTAFFLRTVILTWNFFQYCESPSLKRKKNVLNKMQATYKLFDIARHRGKTLKK